MDVGSWLRSLGLGQYEANFRDNKIDADVLPQLTADDLKDIHLPPPPHNAFAKIVGKRHPRRLLRTATIFKQIKADLGTFPTI